MHPKKSKVVNSPVWNKRLGGKGRAAPLAATDTETGDCSASCTIWIFQRRHGSRLIMRLFQRGPVRLPGCLLIPVHFSEPFPLNAPSVRAAEAPL